MEMKWQLSGEQATSVEKPKIVIKYILPYWHGLDVERECEHAGVEYIDVEVPWHHDGSE